MSESTASKRVLELACAIDALAACDLTALPDSALCADIVAMHRQMNRLHAVWLQRVRIARQRGATDDAGYVSTAAFLRHTCHLTPGSGRAQVDTAEALQRRPAVENSFAAGDFSYQHAAIVTRGLDEFPSEIADDAEPVLIEAAAKLDPKGLAQVVRRLRHIVDPDGQKTRDLRHREQRWLDLATTFDGMVSLTGLLDAESGAVVQTWLDAATPPPSTNDERTTAQRRADALTELARATLNSGQLPATGGMRPHVSVVVDLATLLANSTAPAELAFAGPVSAETARRISCDAAITRVVVTNPELNAGVPPKYFEALPPHLRARRQILDVGRATRTIPPAIRKALIVRDGRCQFPGCDRPPHWCDAHHIWHWARGGPTALTNLVLLCACHHTVVHEEEWQIRLLPTGAEFERPALPAVPRAG